MYKKIIIIVAIFFMTGCAAYNLDTISLEDSVKMAINQNEILYNTNNVGYRYYLPRGFILNEDRDNIQILKHEGTEYYLNVDLVSYYNKTEIEKDSETSLYKYIDLSNENKTGFLEIVKNNNYFYIKMVYNYAIIETQVKERELQKSAINMAYILASIKYNDTVINNKLGEDVLEFNETTYKIFKPKKVSETKSHAYYLELYDKYTGKIDDKIEDPDVIN